MSSASSDAISYMQDPEVSGVESTQMIIEPLSFFFQEHIGM